MNNHPPDEEPTDPETVMDSVVMLIAVIVALSVMLAMMGCATKKESAPSPQYAGVTRKVEDISNTISQVQSDSKEVKRLQDESLSLLDRLDYKTTILLK